MIFLFFKKRKSSIRSNLKSSLCYIQKNNWKSVRLSLHSSQMTFIFMVPLTNRDYKLKEKELEHEWQCPSVFGWREFLKWFWLN